MNKTELEKGTRIELEHSKSLSKFLKRGVNINAVAKAIARDHLKEDSQYYKKLGIVEGLKDTKQNLVVQKALPPYNEKGKTTFNLRNQSGVYLIYKNNTLQYVGFSRTDVYKALYRHLQRWNDPTQQRIVFNDLKGITVRMVYTKSGAMAQRLEGALIIKHKPPLNINRYDGFILDEKEKNTLEEFNEAPKEGIYQYKGDLPF